MLTIPATEVENKSRFFVFFFFHPDSLDVVRSGDSRSSS